MKTKEKTWSAYLKKETVPFSYGFKSLKDLKEEVRGLRLFDIAWNTEVTYKQDNFNG
jgi:hypothetical protein